MTSDQRAKFVEDFLAKHTVSVMAGKGKEYSRGEDDVNSNFKRVGQSSGLDPLTVAYVYAAKHWDSISNYVKNRNTPSGEPIEGRLGDLINYMLILASLIEETKVWGPGQLLAGVGAAQIGSGGKVGNSLNRVSQEEFAKIVWNT